MAKKYDFDKLTDRRGTGCLKYDCGPARIGRDDLLPLWVADMDFALPSEILEDLHARIDHGIFGYTEPDDVYYEAMSSWFLTRYGWKIDKEWNTVVPGVVYGIACAIRALTEPGDVVIIQEPVYYPFKMMIEENGRTCVSSDLINKDGRYEMDLEDLEKKIVDNGAKAMILCTPHNPVGRVWTREELSAVDEICRRHHVRLIVDEIHCDFIFPGHTFTPFGALGEESLNNAVICTSPSKTFNIAGLQVSNILIADPDMRRAFIRANSANGYDQANIMGLTAAKAVFEKGGEWLDALIAYLWENVNYVNDFLKENLPELKMTIPEGTYLVWIDFSEAVKTPAELKHLIRDEAKLWLDNGAIFSAGTALFERINIACPRSTLEQAMQQLYSAMRK